MHPWPEITKIQLWFQEIYGLQKAGKNQQVSCADSAEVSCTMPFPKAWSAFLRGRKGASVWPTIVCLNIMCLIISSQISKILWESQKKLFPSNNKTKLWNHKKYLKFEHFKHFSWTSFSGHIQINFFPLKAAGIVLVIPMPNSSFRIFITHMSTVF